MRHRLLHIILIQILGFIMLSACHVHELPNEQAKDPTVVHVHLHLSPPEEMTLFEADERSRSDEESAAYTERLIVEWKNLATGRVIGRNVITRPLEKKEKTFDLNEILSTEIYQLSVWRDIVPSGETNDYYYDTTDFSTITLLGEHQGCLENKDAYTTTAKIDLTSYRAQWECDHYQTISLERPLARFELVTTDVVKYLEKLEARSDKASDGIERLTIKILYPSYFPDGFDLYENRPNHVSTGIGFHSSLVRLSENEASMGFDYLFVNGAQSGIDVGLIIYNERGEEVNRTDCIHIPVKRNHSTIIKGDFLTLNYDSGIGIETEFDGHINIIIP